MYYKRFILFYWWLMAVIACGQDLILNTSVTENTHCGNECRYSGPSILINEVMIMPEENVDGSIFGPLSCFDLVPEGEWIELYNPNNCYPVDISGYFLGNSTNDHKVTILYDAQGNPIGLDCLLSKNMGAAFCLPQGTIIPPLGFCVLRGKNAPPVPDSLLIKNGGNTFEVVVEDFMERFCLATGGQRFWMPNAGAWFAFYDKNGIPQDALSWGATDTIACADCYPCTPNIQNEYAGFLSSYSQIPENRKTKVSTYSLNNFLQYRNKTLRRIPDGGTWQVNDFVSASMGGCNASCLQSASHLCQGSASVTVTGGSGNYSYRWSDAQHQTTPTALNLCGGDYKVYVTDNVTSITISAQVNVPETKPIANAGADVVLCQGDTVQLGTAPHSQYTYKWTPNFSLINDGIANPRAFPTETTNYNLLVVDNNTNCSSYDDVLLSVKMPKSSELTSTICAGESYLFGNRTFTQSGIYKDTLQAVNACDSIVTLTLNVIPPLYNSIFAKICEGEVYSFASRALQATGQYTNVFRSAQGCDSIVTLMLQVEPKKYTTHTASICADESYFFLTKRIMESGFYKDSVISSSGCDSVINLQLIVHPVYKTHQDISILWGEYYQINNHFYDKPGVYNDMFISKEGCDSLVVTKLKMIYSNCPAIVIPPYFSPNNDGINDTFEIENISCYPGAEVQIYDRYSKLLKKYCGSEQGWDGIYNGTQMPSNDYWYIVRIPEIARHYTGHFRIVR